MADRGLVLWPDLLHRLRITVWDEAPLHHQSEHADGSQSDPAALAMLYAWLRWGEEPPLWRLDRDWAPRNVRIERASGMLTDETAGHLAATLFRRCRATPWISVDTFERRFGMGVSRAGSPIAKVVLEWKPQLEASAEWREIARAELRILDDRVIVIGQRDGSIRVSTLQPGTRGALSKSNTHRSKLD